MLFTSSVWSSLSLWMNGYPTELDFPPDTQDWNLDFNEKLIRNYKKRYEDHSALGSKEHFCGIRMCRLEHRKPS